MYAKYIASLPLEVVGVIGTIPFIYIIVYVLYNHINIFKFLCIFLRKYRLQNPEKYRQLLPNADCPENEHSNSATPAGLG